MTQEDQLYVRVDGYNVLLEDLEAVRQTVENISEAADVLQQVREVKSKTLNTMETNLGRLDGRLEDLQQEMPENGAQTQPETVEQTTRQEPEPVQEPQIDDSVRELQDELQNLQSELQGLDQ
nr:MAG: hypothetical protein J07AB56_11390 [Candidatus Nanosalinarum sp. J07AB56]